ncbi:hypothetical protein JCM30471_16170 [Desulfuromonas carbonis]
MNATRNTAMLVSVTIIGAIIVLLTLLFLNDHLVNVYTALAVFVLSAVTSTVTHRIVSGKYADLIAKAQTLKTFYVYVNVYIGMAVGIVSGTIIGWLLLYPFSLFFGHPEEVSWSTTKTYAFESLVVMMTLFTTAFFIRYFFHAGIHHVKKGLKSDK